MSRGTAWGLLAAFTAVLVVALGLDRAGMARQWSRDAYLLAGATQQEIATLAPHLVVGFGTWREAEHWALRYQVGGLYLTHRNTRTLSKSSLRERIARLQDLRREAGLPPLWLCTDQEGGEVNRLSPPLTPHPPLSHLVKGDTLTGDARARAGLMGYVQGREMHSLGLNLNLAPVVDLKPQERTWNDFHSRLDLRAASDSPAQVSTLTRAYAEGLIRAGIAPTLKHFPGLGSVREDTHHAAGVLETSLDQLLVRDWLPYLEAGRLPAFVMVAHVRVAALGDSLLASASPAVIDTLLRRKLGFSGPVLSDDACMGPFRKEDGGLGTNAVRFLKAGGDLLLVSHRPRMANSVLAAWLRALRKGELNPHLLAQSRNRISQAAKHFLAFDTLQFIAQNRNYEASD